MLGSIPEFKTHKGRVDVEDTLRSCPQFVIRQVYLHGHLCRRPINFVNFRRCPMRVFASDSGVMAYKSEPTGSRKRYCSHKIMTLNF
jgi:hypothetical protein